MSKNESHTDDELRMQMEDSLNEIISIIDEYNKAELTKQTGNLLNAYLQSLTTNLFYLEIIRSDYHKRCEKLIFDLTRGDWTNAKATNRANAEYPELYLLRRVMTSAYKVVESIRTNISYIKQEMSNLS